MALFNKGNTLDSKEWDSDCFQFNYDDLDKFKEFVKKLTDTFITVDKVAVFNMCVDMERQIENIKKQMDKLVSVNGIVEDNLCITIQEQNNLS